MTPIRTASPSILALQGAPQRRHADAGAAPLDIPEAYATLDAGGRLTFVNAEAQHLLRQPGEALLGRPLWRVLDPGGRASLRVELAAALGVAHAVELQVQYLPLGQWLELRAVPRDGGLAVTLRDVTARKVSTDRIERLAYFDALTQLPNRKLLLDRLQARLLKPGTGFSAVMFIDLDNFKTLNDTGGHARGDLLLQVAAGRLAACVRTGDTVARLGGDEFVVMLTELGPRADVATAKVRSVAGKILDQVRQPCELEGQVHSTTCSIGATVFVDGEGDVSEVMKRTDLAMYRAKAAGGNDLCFYDAEMRSTAAARSAQTASLRDGLGRNELLLHYQAQFDGQGRPIGAEALVRWDRPGHPVLPAAAFIGLAEQSGLILCIDHWVLEGACAQLAAWAAHAETRDLSVVVNVSERQFRLTGFVPAVFSLLERARVPANRLRLELPERLFATGLPGVIARMKELRQGGVRLAVGDFGSGHLGIAQLQHLPLDQVTIDQVFVKEIQSGRHGAAVAQSLMALARSLDLAIAAEGVETERQHQFLRRHGCGQFQGYLYGAPLPVDELETCLRQRWSALRETGTTARIPLARARSLMTALAPGRAAGAGTATDHARSAATH